MKRLGINLGRPTNYDSGQILKNLIWLTYGFEATEARATLQCGAIGSHTCVDKTPYSSWENNFAAGFTYEVVGGPAHGHTGTVTSSVNRGGTNTLTLSGDTSSWPVGTYITIRGTKPGFRKSDVGLGNIWATGTNYGASTDTCGTVCGSQSLDMNIGATSKPITQNNFFDSTGGRSFVVLKGTYQISFYAKLKKGSGSNALSISVARNDGDGPNVHYSRSVSLPGDSSWHKYSYTTSINESSDDHTDNNSATVSFTVAGGSEVLLDNESFEQIDGDPTNTTVFRDEVVSTLRKLHPGVMRYMDDSANAGNSLADLTSPDGRRMLSQSSVVGSGSGFVPYSLHQFLDLCDLVGAEPWFTIPNTFTSQEMTSLAEYLGGSASTHYGAIRAAQGQSVPWTTVFHTIHLELGNEMWNGIFASAMSDMNSLLVGGQAQYGQHADVMFKAMKSSPYWEDSKMDLIKSGWSTNQVTIPVNWSAGAYWTNIQHTPGGVAAEVADHFSAAPYLITSLTDCSSNEAMFLPMFAEGSTALWDNPNPTDGLMASLGIAATNKKNGVEVYEVNLGTNNTTCSQAQVTKFTASQGAGLGVVSHMLSMQKNAGIQVQNMFALTEYQNYCGSAICPLWGAVIDMGGESGRWRPTALMLQLANDAILGMSSEITTTQTGLGTFNSGATKNDAPSLLSPFQPVFGIPVFESYAFTDGNGNYSMILINKNMYSPQTVTLSGSIVPTSTTRVEKVTSGAITDTNENSAKVILSTATVSAVRTVNVPAFSAVMLRWGPSVHN